MPLKWVPGGGNTYETTFFVEVSRNNDIGAVTYWGVVERPLKRVRCINNNLR